MNDFKELRAPVKIARGWFVAVDEPVVGWLVVSTRGD